MIKVTPLLFIFAFMLTACDPISGSIQVVKKFQMFSRGNSSGCGSGELPPCEADKLTEVAPGSYDFDLDFQSKNSALLTIKMQRNTAVGTLTIPDGKNIPQNGQVTLSESELGQPFSLLLNVSTVVTDSGLRADIETCTYQVRERYCHPVHRPGGGVVCEDRLVDRYGQQRVEYFYRTTDKKMDGDVRVSKGAETVAHLNGGRLTNEKIYTYKDICY